MPDSSPSPSHLRVARHECNRLGSTQSTQPPVRLGKQSTSERLVEPLLVSLQSKRAASIDHSVILNTVADGLAKAQKLGIAATYKRHREINENSQIPRSASASNIRPPSVQPTRLLLQIASRARSGSHRPPISGQQLLPEGPGLRATRVYRRSSGSGIAAHRGGPIPPAATQRPSQYPVTSSDPLPVLEAKFTFRANVSETRPQNALHSTHDSSQENVRAPEPRCPGLTSHRTSLRSTQGALRGISGDNKGFANSVTEGFRPLRPHSALSNVKRSTSLIAGQPNRSKDQNELKRRSSMACDSTHTALDTPAARERGLRRLGSLMLLPGSQSNVKPTASVAKAILEKTETDSRCTTPTPRNYVVRDSTRASSHTRDQVHYLPSYITSSSLAPQVGPISSDQTCATLAALSINEETMLIGDDALLTDLCTVSSRIDMQHEDERITQRARSAQGRSRATQIASDNPMAVSEGLQSGEGIEIEHTSEGYIRTAELQEKIDVLTRALSDETIGRSADAARLAKCNADLVKENSIHEERTRKLEAILAHRDDAIAFRDVRIKELKGVGRRALIGEAVAGYDELIRTIHIEIDVVKGERDVCLMLSRTLCLLSRAL